MIRPVARAAALVLLAPFLTFASALAPQHIHETGHVHDHGHDHAVAHSHFAPHHHAAHDSDDLEIEGDVDHGHVVWLTSPVLHEAPYRQAPVPPAVPVSYDAIVVDVHWSITPFDEGAPAHGPPRLTVLFRGPPSLA